MKIEVQAKDIQRAARLFTTISRELHVETGENHLVFDVLDYSKAAMARLTVSSGKKTDEFFLYTKEFEAALKGVTGEIRFEFTDNQFCVITSKRTVRLAVIDYGDKAPAVPEATPAGFFCGKLNPASFSGFLQATETLVDKNADVVLERSENSLKIRSSNERNTLSEEVVVETIQEAITHVKVSAKYLRYLAGYNEEAEISFSENQPVRIRCGRLFYVVAPRVSN